MLAKSAPPTQHQSRWSGNRLTGCCFIHNLRLPNWSRCANWIREKRQLKRGILKVIEIDLIDIYLIRTTVILFDLIFHTTFWKLNLMLTAMILQLNEIGSKNPILFTRMLEHP